MMGTTARSWNSSTDTMVRPGPVPMSPDLSSDHSTRAVDDSATMPPHTAASATGRPLATATAKAAPPVSSTCTEPPPKTEVRSFHRSLRRSLMPTVNNSRMTPTSATSSIWWRSRIRPRPPGPIRMPARMNPTTGGTWNRRSSAAAATAAAITRTSSVKIVRPMYTV